jgi:hypothetical protein
VLNKCGILVNCGAKVLVILPFGKWRQEEFEASLSYITRLCIKKKIEEEVKKESKAKNP